jgi:hypothetical protein
MKNQLPSHPIAPIPPRKPVEPREEDKIITISKKIGSFRISQYSSMPLEEFYSKINEIVKDRTNTTIDIDVECDYDDSSPKITLVVHAHEKIDNPNYPRRVKEYKEELVRYEERMPQYEKVKELYDYKVKQFEIAMAKYYAEKTADYEK